MRTIQLDDEAYEQLENRRRDDESFSDAIKRLTNGRSLLELAGILSDEEADELESTIARGRERSRERSDELARRFE